MQLSQSFETLERDALLVNKLNVVLVQILKHEWPTNWPSFIPEIVESSQSSESLCENNLSILRLLAEEVFEFSEDQLTSSKGKNFMSCPMYPHDIVACAKSFLLL